MPGLQCLVSLYTFPPSYQESCFQHFNTVPSWGGEMRMSFPWGGQGSKVSCTEQKSSLALLPNPRSPCLSQSDQQPDSRGFTQSLLQA